MAKGIPMSVRSFAAAVATPVLAVLFTILFAACLPLFDGSLTTQVGDEMSPYITILTPADGSSYAAVVLVEGVVDDEIAEGGPAGDAISVAFEVLSTSISGSTAVNDNGSFSFSFETVGLSGTITVSIVAVDWNGNETETFLTLSNEGSVPSFTAVAGNKKVTLRWDDVALASQYNVRFTDTGRIPSESVGTLLSDRTSPLEVAGLENGGEYSFLLEVQHEGGSTSWSEVVSAIPLSEFTLLPTIDQEYEKIVLRWNYIEGADRYEVWRSLDPYGSFSALTGARESNEYVDLDVSSGSRYYYSVRPSHPSGVASGVAAGSPSPFPDKALDLLSSVLEVFQTGWSIAVDGDLAYVGVFGAFISYWADFYVYDITTPASPSLIGTTRLHSDSTVPIEITYPIDLKIVNYPPNVFALVTSGEDRLHVVDATVPGSPQEMSQNDGVFEVAREIEIDGTTAYIADMTGGAGGQGGLVRLDLSDPFDSANPFNLGSRVTYTTAGPAYGLAIRGDYAYVAVSNAGLEVVRLSDMHQMSLVDTGASGGNAVSVTLDGDYAYVALEDVGPNTGGIGIVDIRTPGGETAVGFLELPGDTDNPGNGVDVTVSAGRAYVGNSAAGLAVVDLNDPTDPKLIATETTAGFVDESAMAGDNLFVTSQSFLPINSYRINPYPQPAPSQVVVPVGDRLIGLTDQFAVVGDSNATAIDVYDRATGSLNVSIPLEPGHQLDLGLVHNDHVFYTSSTNPLEPDGRLDVIDLHGAGGVERLGTGLEIDNFTFSIIVDGDYAYVGGFNVLHVVDIADPAAMTMAGFASVPDAIVGMVKRDNYIFAPTAGILTGAKSMVSIDATFPSRPELLDSISLTGEPTWVGGNDQHLYVGVSGMPVGPECGVQVVNTGDPGALAEAAFVPLGDIEMNWGGDTRHVSLRGHIVNVRRS